MNFRKTITSLGLLATLTGCMQEPDFKTETKYQVSELNSNGGVFSRDSPHGLMTISDRDISFSKRRIPGGYLEFINYEDTNKDGQVDRASGDLIAPDGSYFKGDLIRDRDFDKYPDYFDYFDKDFTQEVKNFQPTLEKYRVWPIFKEKAEIENKK
ncbi:MAG: hypothetical protein AABW73_04545 [Nanoarchaeota archaeon]